MRTIALQLPTGKSPKPVDATSTPRYDRDSVKSAAVGHWPAILNRVAGIDDDYICTTHGSCPSCGGSDRWRVFDNFNQTGGAVCNQCGPKDGKMADGIAVVQWALGISFPDALKRIAEFIGVQPSDKTAAKTTKKQARPVDEQIRIDDKFYPAVFAAWSRKKGGGITPDGANACYATTGKHLLKKRDVIAVPVFGESLDVSQPIGYWYAYATNDPIQGDTKAKLTAGCTGDGICATRAFIDAIKSGTNLTGETIWKVEGIPDLIALAGLRDGILAFTNKSGADEKPYEGLIGQIATSGARAVLIGDSDEPGQRGAKRWGKAMSQQIADVRIVKLPYDVTPTKGKDLRDQIIEGHSYDDLLARADSTPKIERTELDDLEANEDPHDPARIARVNISRHRANDGDLRYWQGQWWRYRRGCWIHTHEDELKAKLRIGISAELIRIVEAAEEKENGTKPKRKPLTRGLVNDVLDAMKSPCLLSSSVEMPCWLPDRSRRQLLSVRNGLIDIDAVIAGDDTTDAFMDHSSSWFSGTQVDYDFDPLADCPKWLEYLERSIVDNAVRNLVQEWAGYLLTSTNPFQKFLAVEGDGGTGKSVLASGLTAMLGEQSVSNADLAQFGTQFGLGVTIGKALNLDSDVEKYAKFSEGIFKKFCIGERMDFQLKGGNPFSQCPTAKVMLLWNERPRIKDSSNGFWRRMLLVPFSNVVPASKRVYGMDQPSWWRDQGELPGILNWAIQGLRRLFEQGCFTEPESVRRLVKGYRDEMDPVLAFLNDMIETGDDHKEHFEATQSIVAAFKGWCTDFATEKDAEAMNPRKMGKAIAKRFPVATPHTSTLHTETRLRGFKGITLRNVPKSEETCFANVRKQPDLDGF